MKFDTYLQELNKIATSYVSQYLFHDRIYEVRFNHEDLKNTLDVYFREWLVQEHKEAFQVVKAYETELPEFDHDFIEYRETPEKRMKEAYVDLSNGYRLIKKVKTGVHFAVKEKDCLAMGPLKAYSNQLINYLNAIFMEDELHGDHMLFHAAGVAVNGEGIVIAAPSGKGKSTTSLYLVNEGLDFVSNDRVILQKRDDHYEMIGVPKHPRVNPGTLLNNPKVKHLLRDPERFDGLSREEVWNWEEKYDVVIPDIYGSGKFPLAAKAKGLLIINWGEDSGPLRIETLDFSKDLSLMPAIMKKPSLMTPTALSRKRYLTEIDYMNYLKDLPVYVLLGKINPEEALQLIKEELF